MTKDEIALSFEQAEYYTLQEACDYLNMKHGINNITIKKIFANILKYHTKVCFHAKGFQVLVSFSVMYGKQLNFDREYIDKIYDKALFYLNTIMHDGEGLLLFLTRDILEKLRFSETATFHNEDWAFCAALDPTNLQGNPLSFDFLPISKTDLDILYGLSSIHPKFYKYTDDDWEEIFAKSSLKVSKYDIYSNDDGKEYADAFYEIGREDLIILYTELMELENNIINHNPAPQKDKLEVKQIRPRAGVGMEKLVAKEYAKIIAKHLWSKDGEQKIRMLEMAHLVYSEIHKSVLADQLPDNPNELQKWIKDVAPAYARKGGRPRNEP